MLYKFMSLPLELGPGRLCSLQELLEKLYHAFFFNGPLQNQPLVIQPMRDGRAQNVLETHSVKLSAGVFLHSGRALGFILA